MLILDRRLDRTVRIGSDILVKVVAVRGKYVRLGIEAPRALPVYREDPGRVRAASAGRIDDVAIRVISVSACSEPSDLVFTALARCGVDDAVGLDDAECFGLYLSRSDGPPNLILCDSGLGVDGVRSIRGAIGCRTTPIIVFTKPGSGEIDGCLEAGATACVHRPSDPDDFMEVMYRTVTFWRRAVRPGGPGGIGA